jgi:integrase
MPDNLYRRGATWWGRIQVRGKDVRRSLRTPVLAEAKRRLKALVNEAEHYRYHGENRHIWEDAVKGWAATAPDHIRRSTLTRYLCSLKQLRPMLDGVHLDQIGRKIIAGIARRPGVTNATRRRDLTAVSMVLRWTVSAGWREDNPARDWDRSAIKERREPIALPRDGDIEAVLAECPDNFYRMVRLAQYTGMRQEECASLERPQISTLRKAIDLTKTKTNPRSVPLDERALGVIEAAPVHFASKAVFWHGKGARYANVSSRFAMLARRAVAKAKAAGRPDVRAFRFHDLRHWYAVDYLRRGGSIYDLQQILGHASIKTTEVYLRYLTPDESQLAKRIGVGTKLAQQTEC